MKKAYPILCVFLALLLLFSLWGLHYLRNYYRKPLNPNPLPPSQKTFAIDISSAGIEELCCLPGIGETLAQRIIDYRDTYGKFTHIRDIQNVKGIGKSIYEQIAPYIYIGGSP